VEYELKLDMFDRRFRVFSEVRGVLSAVLRDADIKKDLLLKFRSGVVEADFLFGPEIVEYIDQIYFHGLKLSSANERHVNMFDRPAGYDVKRGAMEMDAELGWLTDQLPEIKKKFKKYLDISK
jgi:hypothetical protein